MNAGDTREASGPAAHSWVDGADESLFSLQNLPLGVFAPDGAGFRVGARIGDVVVDLAGLAGVDRPELAGVLAAPTLNGFLAAGPAGWAAVRDWLTARLADHAARRTVEPHLRPLDGVRLGLPFAVADYVDFYSSLEHATNLGTILRPGQPALHRNWRHVPVGYHGRAGTVVVSGTPVGRPAGHLLAPGAEAPAFGPSRRLDIEAEVGFVVGVGSPPGRPVPASAFAAHVFGVCLLNDWSARDIQAFEYVPLGPFLGKSFATSISAWVTPLAALGAARVAGPVQDPHPLPHLARAEPWGLDLALEVAWNGTVVSRPPFAGMYWTADQLLAHLTSNGAGLRTGDLFASGTVSGPEPDQRGSFVELSWNGRDPIQLAGGATRTFLADGDEVRITATAPGTDGRRIGLGEVRGRVRPTRS